MSQENKTYSNFELQELLNDNTNYTQLHFGDAFVLLGANGSGKTIILNTITGMLGSFYSNSEIPTILNQNNGNKFQLSIGISNSFEGFIPKLSVSEQLKCFGKISGAEDNQGLDNQITEIIKNCSLTGYENYFPENLSKGQRKALSVAIALIGLSKILVFDDPTSCMDSLMQETLLNYLKSIKKSKVIIISTQNMDEAELIGNKFAFLEKGRIFLLNSNSFFNLKHENLILSIESNDAFFFGYNEPKYNNPNHLTQNRNKIYHLNVGVDLNNSDASMLEKQNVNRKELIKSKDIKFAPSIVKLLEKKRVQNLQKNKKEILKVNKNNILFNNEEEKFENSINIFNESKMQKEDSITDTTKPHKNNLKRNSNKFTEINNLVSIELVLNDKINIKEKNFIAKEKRKLRPSDNFISDQNFENNSLINEESNKKYEKDVNESEKNHSSNKNCNCEVIKFRSQKNKSSTKINVQTLQDEIQEIFNPQNTEENKNDCLNSLNQYPKVIISVISMTQRTVKFKIPIEQFVYKENKLIELLEKIFRKYDLISFEIYKQKLEELFIEIQKDRFLNDPNKNELHCENTHEDARRENANQSANQLNKKKEFHFNYTICFPFFNFLNKFKEIIRMKGLSLLNPINWFLLIIFLIPLLLMLIINLSFCTLINYDYSKPIQQVYYNFSSNPQLFYYSFPPTSSKTNCDNNSTVMAQKLTEFLQENSNINLVQYPDTNLNPDLEDHLNKFYLFVQKDLKERKSYINGSLFFSFDKIFKPRDNSNFSCSNNLFIFVNLSNPNSTGLVTSHIFDSLLRFFTNDTFRIFFSHFPLPISTYAKSIMKAKVSLKLIYFFIVILCLFNLVLTFSFSEEYLTGLARIQKLFGGELPFWISNIIIDTLIKSLFPNLIYLAVLYAFQFPLDYGFQLTTLFSIVIVPYTYFMLIIMAKFFNTLYPEIQLLLINLMIGNFIPIVFQILRRFNEYDIQITIIETILMIIFPIFAIHQGFFYSLENISKRIYIFPFYSGNTIPIKIKLVFSCLAISLVLYYVLIFIREHFYFLKKLNYIKKNINQDILNPLLRRKIILNSINKIDEKLELSKNSSNSELIDKLKLDTLINPEIDNILTLVGISGSGKSYIIDLLSYSTFGQDALKENIEEINNQNIKSNVIGYCPEENIILPFLTLHENIKFYLSLFRFLNESELNEQCLSILRQFHLIDYQYTLGSELSQGILKLLKIAIIFYSESSLLLLDDFWTGIDPIRKILLGNILRRTVYNNKIRVILSTNKIKDILMFANQIQYVYKGKNLYIESIDKMKEDISNNPILLIEYKTFYNEGTLKDHILYLGSNGEYTSDEVKFRFNERFQMKNINNYSIFEKQFMEELNTEKKIIKKVEGEKEVVLIPIQSFYRIFLPREKALQVLETIVKDFPINIEKIIIEKSQNCILLRAQIKLQNVIPFELVQRLYSNNFNPVIELIKISNSRNSDYEKYLQRMIQP